MFANSEGPHTQPVSLNASHTRSALPYAARLPSLTDEPHTRSLSRNTLLGCFHTCRSIALFRNRDFTISPLHLIWQQIVSIFWRAVLGEGSVSGIWPEPRELPLSLIWDKNRLGVRSWGGGGMPENCHWTEVGRLHIYKHIVLVRMVS